MNSHPQVVFHVIHESGAHMQALDHAPAPQGMMPMMPMPGPAMCGSAPHGERPWTGPMYHQPFSGPMGCQSGYMDHGYCAMEPHMAMHQPMGHPMAFGGNPGFAAPTMGHACAQGPPPGAQPMYYVNRGQQVMPFGPGAMSGAGMMGGVAPAPPYACMGAGGMGAAGAVATSSAAAMHKGQRAMRAAKLKSSAPYLRRTRNAERQGQIQSLVGKLAAEINGNVQGKATEPLSEGAGSGSEAAH